MSPVSHPLLHASSPNSRPPPAFPCLVQAAFRRISLDVFGHLLDLDHAFHLHRKTGQIMRILDRGTSSIQVGPGRSAGCGGRGRVRGVCVEVDGGLDSGFRGTAYGGG